MSGQSKRFFAWVASRRAGDNSRGDFIRDTREALANGAPTEAALNGLARLHHPALLAALKREYRRRKQ